jgi:hypothetical protein
MNRPLLQRGNTRAFSASAEPAEQQHPACVALQGRPNLRLVKKDDES